MSADIDPQEAALKKLDGEVRAMQGRLKNANAAEATQMGLQNKRLEDRVEKLIQAVGFLEGEAAQPSLPEDLKYRTECLRKSTVDFCQKSKLDVSLWKDIES